VRQAIAWKSSLRTGVPAGWAWLGGKEATACSKAINQMVADLFARTELDDAAVGHVRLAMEKIADWAQEWGKAHDGVGGRVKVEYRIGDGGAVEWVLSEEVPGMLTETFFKDAERKDGAVKDGAAKVGRMRGLLGWVAVLLKKESETEGGNNAAAKWEEILQLTGAGQFEMDVRRKSVRMVRCAVPVETVGA
jgi:hypothetical protein